MARTGDNSGVIIQKWLDEQLLPKCYEDVIKRRVSLEEIPLLTSEKLEELGISNLLIRIRFVAKLKELQGRLSQLATTPTEMPTAVVECTGGDDDSYDVPATRVSKTAQLCSASVGPQQSSSSFDQTVRPNDDLRQQPYYHARLRRIDAERLVRKQGDFLIRDCISSPGDFVLSCRWAGECVHFQVNKVTIPCSAAASKHSDQSQTTASTVLYQFEEEQFESIVDLIEFYRAHGRTITEGSQCTLGDPVVRLIETDPQSDLVRDGAGHQVHHRAASPCLSGDRLSALQRAEERPTLAHGGGAAAANYETMPARQLPFGLNGITNAHSPNPNLVNRPLPVPPPTPKPMPLIQKWSSEVKLPKLSSCDISLQHYNSAEDVRRRNGSLVETPKRQPPPKPSKPASTSTQCGSAVVEEQEDASWRSRLLIRDSSGALQRVTLQEEERPADDADVIEEYCDIDYEQMNSPTFRPGSSNEFFNDDRGSLNGSIHSKSTNKSLSFTPEPAVKPALPPRTPRSSHQDHQQTSCPETTVGDRDSACVLDFALYDEPIRQTPTPLRRSLTDAHETYSTPASLHRVSADSGRLLAHNGQSTTSGGRGASPLPSALPTGPCRPLDAAMLAHACGVIRTTTAVELASALTAGDFTVMATRTTVERRGSGGAGDGGINKEDCDDDVSKTVAARLTGVARILLPEEEQLRMAVLERSYSLECFVLLTICKAAEEAEKLRICLIWIECADVLWRSLGNHFSFVSVMRALVRTQRSKEHTGGCPLWTAVASGHAFVWRNFENCLLPAWHAVETGAARPSYGGAGVTIPFVQNVARWLSDGMNAAEQEPLFDGNPASLEAVWNILQNARKWHQLARHDSPSAADAVVSPPKKCSDDRVLHLLQPVRQVRLIVGDECFARTTPLERVRHFSRLLGADLDGAAPPPTL